MYIILYKCIFNGSHFVVTSILLKRGADYNIEDHDGARPDDLALIYRAASCHKMIVTQRTDRINRLISLVEKVKSLFIW